MLKIFQTFKSKLWMGLIAWQILSGCENGLPLLDVEAIAPLQVQKFDKLSADGGDEVIVSGQGISWALTAAINGQSIAFSPIDLHKGKITLPAELSLGLTRVDFFYKNKKVATLPIVNSKSLDLLPIITDSLDSICDDFIYKDGAGVVTRGTRPCVLPPPACHATLNTGCVATIQFPAVDAATILPENIRVGTSIGDVAGTLSAAPEPCDTDGEVGCLTTASFKSADLAGADAKIMTGATLGGVLGTAPVRPSTCNLDGQDSCVVDGTVFKAAKLSNFTTADIKSSVSIAGLTGIATLAPVSCNADGQGLCVVDGTAFKAAKISNFTAADIKSTVNIAGIAGTAVLTPAPCNTDGQGSCVVDGTLYKAAKLSNFIASDLKLNKTVAGVAGTLSPCAGDNGTSCVTSAAFPSVVLANINPGLIKASTVIAGITGAYPNSTYPIAVSDGYADLDLATFDAKIKSATNFGWFDRNGTRYSGPGDADITAAKLKDGVAAFGETGSYAPACTTDGQDSCAVDGISFKAAKLSNFTAWDLRLGKTVAGVAGSLSFYNNGANLGGFNRNLGVASNASGTVADPYDSIDDFGFAYINGPGATMFGTEVYPGVNWLRDSLSDTNNNASCDGGEACVMQDRITMKKWSKDDGVTRSWEDAITYCHTLNYGGYSTGWRLPTEKELAQAYIDGIWQQRYVLNIVNSTATTAYYWSATSPTSDASYNTNAKAQALFGNVTSHPLKSVVQYVICVR